MNATQPKNAENNARAHHQNDLNYVPALGFHFLTGLYDPVLHFTTRERTFKRALLQQAQLQPSMRALDLACGTGTLAIMAKQMEPDAIICGVDGDPRMLSRASIKAAQLKLAIQFQQAMAQTLPFGDNSFDCALSSLFLHHLQPAQKREVLRELWRVLKPGAALHVADWGEPSNALMRLLFYPVQWLDGIPNTEDHVAGRLPEFITDAGFRKVEKRQQFNTIYGTLSLFRAEKE